MTHLCNSLEVSCVVDISFDWVLSSVSVDRGLQKRSVNCKRAFRFMGHVFLCQHVLKIHIADVESVNEENVWKKIHSGTVSPCRTDTLRVDVTQIAFSFASSFAQRQQRSGTALQFLDFAHLQVSFALTANQTDFKCHLPKPSWGFQDGTSKQVQGLEMRPRLLSPMALLSTVLSQFWAQNWLKIGSNFA